MILAPLQHSNALKNVMKWIRILGLSIKKALGVDYGPEFIKLVEAQ